MQNLQVFKNKQFGEVRTMKVEGETYFVGVDIARALDYANPSKAIIQHCKGITKLGIPSKGGEQETNCIPIGDVFRLGTHSELPGADQFESWIFDEVLPTLHKTGKYEMPKKQSQEERLHIMEMNAKIRKAQLLTKLAVQYKGTTYEQILNSHATKELTGEHILPLPQLEQKTYTAAEIGNRLNISANMVGRLANKHYLKTEEYGKWFHDKAKHSSKEVPAFRYYDNIVPVLKEIINQEVA